MDEMIPSVKEELDHEEFDDDDADLSLETIIEEEDDERRRRGRRRGLRLTAHRCRQARRDMAIFAIGDLHLPGGQDKPMDVFGSHWDDHAARIADSWKQTVTRTIWC